MRAMIGGTEYIVALDFAPAHHLIFTFYIGLLDECHVFIVVRQIFWVDA